MSDLRIYIIYDHPTDYPEYFVVRGQTIRPLSAEHDKECLLSPDLESARAYIQKIAPGSVCVTRHPSDDPKIVESWL